jgi:hypothetical protein
METEKLCVRRVVSSGKEVARRSWKPNGKVDVVLGEVEALWPAMPGCLLPV